MLDQVGGVEGSAPSYPPYNIARTGENDYRISVAVAGFTAADLSIEVNENTLALCGEKQTDDEEKSGDVLYQGIAARNFERPALRGAVCPLRHDTVAQQSRRRARERLD